MEFGRSITTTLLKNELERNELLPGVTDTVKAKKPEYKCGAKLETNPSSPNTGSNGRGLQRRVTETVARLRDTNEIWFIHRKIERSTTPSGVSKEQHPNATSAGVEEANQRWIQATKLNPPKTLHDCIMRYSIVSGIGEILPANIDNAFYFPDLPPEIESLDSEREKVKWLRDFIWRGFDDGRSGESAGPADGAVVVLRADYYGSIGRVTKKIPFRSTIDFEPTTDGSKYEVFYRELNKDTGEIIREHKEQTVSTYEQAEQTTRILARKKLEEAKEQQKRLATITPESFAEPPPQIDPADTHKLASVQDRREMEEARLKVLRRKWRRTFKAMDEKADALTVKNAYLLDVAELTGHEAFPAGAPQLADQVAGALYNHSRRAIKSKTLLIDYAIAFYWPKLVYLNNKEFAKAVKDTVGVEVTPAQAKQRRVRLNLSSRCPPGRPLLSDAS